MVRSADFMRRVDILKYLAEQRTAVAEATDAIRRTTMPSRSEARDHALLRLDEALELLDTAIGEVGASISEAAPKPTDVERIIKV